jgi:hypothetical protein
MKPVDFKLDGNFSFPFFLHNDKAPARRYKASRLPESVGCRVETNAEEDEKSAER